MSNRHLYPHWRDINNSGQDARQDALQRDSLIPVTRDDKGRITGGLWVCKGTANIFWNASEVDADHIIAIDEVHRIGGADKSAEWRLQIANDPENIIIVSAAWNRKKSNRSPFGRMPANIAWWDEYLDLRQCVRDKYQLGYLPGEQDAIAFFRSKAKHHAKGINIDRARAFMGRYFGWVYSPI